MLIYGPMAAVSLQAWRSRVTQWFVVASLPCFNRFSLGSLSGLPSTKANVSKFLIQYFVRM
jgi:hypothetical protein